MNIKKESKYTNPIKHILINDAGIGSNRIVKSNNYLNNFNYFNKNNIKMLEFHKKRYLENKYKAEEFKKEKSIPELAWVSSYYINFNKTNNEYLINDSNNNLIKKAQINYLQDLYDNEEIKKYHLRRNNFRKNFKIYDDLINELNNKKNKNINDIKDISHYSTKYYSTDASRLKNKSNKYYKFYDEKSDYNVTRRNNKIYNLKCKVMFGKTLSTDYGLMNNRKRIIIRKNYLNKQNSINTNNNISNIKLKYEDAINLNHIASKMSSYKEQKNKNSHSISTTSYADRIFEKNEKKYIIKDTENNNILPSIK